MKNKTNPWDKLYMYCNYDNFNSMMEKEMNRKTWQFHVTAPEYQIDFDVIRQDLSPSNPIALIELDGEKLWRGWVLIHESVIEKANLLAEEDDLFDMQYNIYSSAVIDIFEPKEFKVWGTWVKMVKKAPWPEKERNKGVVKVTLKRV